VTNCNEELRTIRNEESVILNFFLVLGKLNYGGHIKLDMFTGWDK